MSMPFSDFASEGRSGVSCQDQSFRKQQGRQDVQAGRVGPAVDRGDADENVVGIGLGVFDKDVEVAVLVEDAGVDQLEFRLTA